MTRQAKKDSRALDLIEGLKATVELFGAQVTNVTDDGVVDFQFGRIGGIARERRSLLRISFFVAFDSPKGEFESFVLELGALPIGDLEVLELDDGTTLRLIVELGFDDHELIRSVGGIARSVEAAWEARASAATDLVQSLWLAGISAPPTVALSNRESASMTDFSNRDEFSMTADGRQLFRFGAWHWATRYIDAFEMYMFYPDRLAQDLVNHGALFAMSHAGHGWNSYGLNLVACSGPLAVFVQHAYGGTFTNPLTDLMAINATYSRLHVLFGAGDRQALVQDLRWLMVYSNFRGASGLIDLDRIREGEAFSDVFETFDTDNSWQGDEPALFASMVEKLELTGFDFGAGGVPTWK